MQGIKENVFFITGAAKGIGRGIARLIAENGGLVIICDKDKEVLGLSDKLKEEGYKTQGYLLDVCDFEAVANVVADVEKNFGPIYGVIPCAGITDSSPALDMSSEQWGRVLDVNVTGTFNVCLATARKMQERSRGVIVNIGSISSIGGQPGRANYVASKWAVAGLTKSLAVEWGVLGIRVNAVAPTAVETDMMQKAVPTGFINNVICDRTPLGRVAQVDDVTGLILFLLSDAAKYINGTVIPVDGGLTAGYLTHQHGADYGLIEKQ